MKILLIITFMVFNRFPAKTEIQFPDMETCEAVKEHMLRTAPTMMSVDTKFECKSVES